MHGTELELKLCALPRRYFFISMKNSGSTFAGAGVLVCGQSIIYHYFNLLKEDYYV
jgi:hypothetical protein